MIEIFTTSPFVFPILISLLASIAIALVGSFVVLKRITLITGSISHSILWGMGLAIWLESAKGTTLFTPLIGAFCAAIVGGLVVGLISYYYTSKEEATLSMIWSAGMSLGVIFLAKTPGYNSNIMDFLFGNLLFITSFDLLLIALLDVVLVCAFALTHKRLLALMFDGTQARLQGSAILPLHLFLHVLIALAIVVLVQLVGVILSLTLLAIPASIAKLYSRSFTAMIGSTFALSVLFCMGGLALSYFFDFPVGPSIALVASFVYIAALFKK